MKVKSRRFGFEVYLFAIQYCTLSIQMLHNNIAAELQLLNFKLKLGPRGSKKKTSLFRKKRGGGAARNSACVYNANYFS